MDRLLMPRRIDYTPHAPQPNALDDVRPGMRPTIFEKRKLIAHDVGESSGDVAVNILGDFHGGQDWEAALRDE